MPNNQERADDCYDYWYYHNKPYSIVESDAILVQPVGFVWFSKLRVKVKALSRKISG